MTDLTLSVTVTRSSLSLADLELNDHSSYEIIRGGISPGSASWERDTVESPFVHGRGLVGVRRGMITGALQVRVRGSSASELSNRTGVLLTAFSQYSYSVTVVLQGVTSTWVCEPADYVVYPDENVDVFEERALVRTVRLSFPRQPVPTAGPI